MYTFHKAEVYSMTESHYPALFVCCHGDLLDSALNPQCPPTEVFNIALMMPVRLVGPLNN